MSHEHLGYDSDLVREGEEVEQGVDVSKDCEENPIAEPVGYLVALAFDLLFPTVAKNEDGFVCWVDNATEEVDEDEQKLA